MKSPPDDVKLSREAGDALITRLQANTVTSDERRLLVKLIQLYFWFTLALRETKISLKRLKRALFGEDNFQADTHVRMLALLAENRRADATGGTLERRGRYTTGLVVPVEQRVICRYLSGRAHAGDNLTALLARREAGQDQPIVRSDALAATQRDDDDTLMRCHCLAHGRRQFTDLDEVFPDEGS